MRTWVQANNKLHRLAAVSAICGCIAAGCSNGSAGPPAGSGAEGGGKQPEESVKPVTLNIFNTRPEVSSNWEQLLVEPLKKKYPHITIQEVKGKLNEVIASGTAIDAYITAEVDLGDYIQAGYTDNIEPYMQAHKMDSNRFDPVVIQTIRGRSAGSKELFGLPFYLQFTALYYNKDIFNAAGVPYPKDGMTWEEAVELGRKVSFSRDGVQYLGIRTDQVGRLAAPFGLMPVDTATDRASVNNEQFKRVFELSQQIFALPGNRPANAKEVNTNPTNKFTKDKVLAMYHSVNRFSTLKSSDVNWDLAQAPFYPDRPNIGSVVDAFMIGIAKTSAHKSDAFKVIEVFTSDEVQLYAARALGYVSPLVHPKLQEQYGAELGFLQGKHLQAVFKSKNLPNAPLSVYHTAAQTILFEEHGKYIMGQMDANTALRTIDEKINQKIAELKAGK
ncbi:hypothetical protein PAESOLCIP111_03766 [Paenibacillus solanacearum]|uniref:Extracellular solute-binding protein n=1 Tax=Paenibacillus solanacearum TaxID=2048548 RepID=A0A916K6M8_9BACL|nr:extracellular solute-binding protein [Paenibacillus solanacearum]CAG7636609.1 hypothetical protein PAESOLCIP111_03766 [Paenibacillus solanacearum]